ncbi:type II toxin-antitoxin system PemK/MazF family toxin [Paracoccus shandongensis]|uniref:type II toxin-antitoxin system PemK/MazF family toxin n=1 Tax=Paracoccus shandongensis TaxID=2816048 RepID=UPI003013AEBC
MPPPGSSRGPVGPRRHGSGRFHRCCNGRCGRLGLKRGDLVTVALQGDHGKPRPALVIQSDLFPDTATTTVLLVTSTLADAPLIRLTVKPSARNGLRVTSQVMIDKAMTVRTDKLGNAFGQLEDTAMVEVNRALALFLGVAG